MNSQTTYRPTPHGENLDINLAYTLVLYRGARPPLLSHIRPAKPSKRGRGARAMVELSETVATRGRKG
jgi:hypothetical protein